MSNLNKIKLKQIDADFSNILSKKTDSYVVVKAGDDLMLKYAEAAALTPNNSARTNFNRATLILFPGEYPTSGEPVFNIDFVDVIALGSSEKIPSVFIEDSSIRVTASNIRVVGISTKFQPFNVSGGEFQVFENCVGGDNSFGFSDGSSGVSLQGTYINCTAGDFSFGYMTGGNDIGITGNFINCTAGNYSFGYTGGGGTLEVSGNFEKCSGGDASFAGSGTASGTFTNCIGGNTSFGGTASGIFSNCTGGTSSFGGFGGLSSGTFTNCTGGDYSFSGGDTAIGGTSDGGQASGIFINCTGGNLSFGASMGIASGEFVDCTGGDGSFGSYFSNASGTFTRCTGGAGSFGGGDTGTLSGKLFYCKLTSDVYNAPSGSGIIRLCIDGNNDVVNSNKSE